MSTESATAVDTHHTSLDKPELDGSVELACSLSEPVSIIPPDGGTQAWATVAGAWMVIFCTFGYLNAFGVYQDFYTREFLLNKTPSDISWIGSFQLFLQYAPGVFVGRLFDAGYFHHIMITGSVIYVVSMVMLSLTQPGQYYQVVLAQGLGMGVAQGLLFLPSLSIIAHHFRLRRSLATGIAVTGASCGGIVFPIMLNTLFNHPRIGFKVGVRASAGVVAGLLGVANICMRTRKPSKSGLQRNGSRKVDIKEIMKDGAYVWSIAGAFLTNLGLFFPYFYLQLYAIEIGVSASTAFYALALLNAGSILGRLVPPFLADRLGIYNMLIPCLFASSILLFAILGVSNFVGIVVVGLGFGFSSGAYVSLIPALLGSLSSHVGELGLRMGIAFSIVAVAMLVGTPIEGALLGDEFRWWRTIAFCGVCISTGTVFMMISRHLYIRRKGGRSQLV